MKIAFTADIQMHNHTAYSKTLPSGRGSRLQAIVDTMRHITDTSVAKGCEMLAIVGDIFHSRTRLDIDVLDACDEVLRYATCHMEVLLIVGNHDQYVKNGKVHSLSAFQRSSLRVVSKPTTIPMDGFWFGCLPFRETAEEVDEGLHAIKNTIAHSSSIISAQPGILLAHIGMDGSVTGPDEIPVREPVNPLNPLFDDYAMAVLGHYHGFQVLREEPFMFYVGSPMQHDFGERGQTKTFSILDTSTWNLDQVHTNAPEFVLLEGTPPAGFQYDSRNYYRVIARTQEEKAAIAELPLGENVTTQTDFVTEAVKRMDIDLTTSMEEAADRYVDHMSPPRAVALKALGRELLQEAAGA